MESASIDLKVRVILVTTRAALRHAPRAGDERRAIIRHGHDLIDLLATEPGTDADNVIARAHAELDALEVP